MDKEIKELLKVAKELRQHADWMGTPPGYSSRDFKPMFDRADKVIKNTEKWMTTLKSSR